MRLLLLIIKLIVYDKTAGNEGQRQLRIILFDLVLNKSVESKHLQLNKRTSSNFSVKQQICKILSIGLL